MMIYRLGKNVMKILLADECLLYFVWLRPLHCQAQALALRVDRRLKSSGASHG